MNDMGDTTTVTLPVLIPLLNLIFSVAALFAWGIVIRRALRAHNWRNGTSARMFFGAFLITLGILVAGALNQAGWMPTELWLVVGTGGRLVVALIGILMASDRALIEAARVRDEA